SGGPVYAVDEPSLPRLHDQYPAERGGGGLLDYFLDTGNRLRTSTFDGVANKGTTVLNWTCSAIHRTMASRARSSAQNSLHRRPSGRLRTSIRRNGREVGVPWTCSEVRGLDQRRRGPCSTERTPARSIANPGSR